MTEPRRHTEYLLGFKITFEGDLPVQAFYKGPPKPGSDKKQDWWEVEELHAGWLQRDFIAWKEDFRSARRKNVAVAQPKKRITFGEFWPIVLKERARGEGGKKHAVRSTRAYTRRLSHPYMASLQDKVLWDLTKEDFSACLDAMDAANEGGINPKTREAYTVAAQMVMSHAIWKGEYGKANPVAALRLDNTPLERQHYIYSPENMLDLWASLEEKYLCIFKLAYGIGLRLNELHGLRVGDIAINGPDDSFVHVRGQMDPDTYEWMAGTKGQRNGKGRIVELPAPLIPVVEAQLSRIKHMDNLGDPLPQKVTRTLQEGDWLFPDIYPQGTGHYVRRLRQELGRPFYDEPNYDDLTMHELRHNFGSLLLDANAPVEYVAAQMGDKPGTVWKHYSHQLQRRMRKPEFSVAHIMGEQMTAIENTGRKLKAV